MNATVVRLGVEYATQLNNLYFLNLCRLGEQVLRPRDPLWQGLFLPRLHASDGIWKVIGLDPHGPWFWLAGEAAAAVASRRSRSRVEEEDWHTTSTLRAPLSSAYFILTWIHQLTSFPSAWFVLLFMMNDTSQTLTYFR